ncbi:MAG: triose-phosphate isomerase [Candidatus Moranbacteria bacterium]|nr:triose-phosphate isomerase [Candidatus Moranbacteria bacterium]
MKYVVGNLKMNILSPLERDCYFKLFKKEIVGIKFKNTEIVLCPPFVYLEDFVSNLGGKYVRIGAQNVFEERSGSYTGEISPPMIKNLGAEYVIVGHSERRRYFGETNASANLKLKASAKAGLHPVYCVGETQEERDAGLTQNVVNLQIEEGLSDVPSAYLENIILVYEPVWSVGTDVVPTSDEVMEARILIKKILVDKYGAKFAERIKILYGGSVKEKNIERLCLEPGMDGVLVGRESLTPYEFIKLAQIISEK